MLKTPLRVFLVVGLLLIADFTQEAGAVALAAGTAQKSAKKKQRARGYCDWLCHNTQNCLQSCHKDAACEQSCQDSQNCQDWCQDTVFGGLFSDSPPASGEKPRTCRPQCTKCEPGSKWDPEDPRMAHGMWKIC